MPRNRIPRRRNGKRDLSKLTSHERIVLSVLYRDPVGLMTFDELLIATKLTRGQLSTALNELCSSQRCAPLGAVALDLIEHEWYRVSPRWRRTRATHSRAATAA